MVYINTKTGVKIDVKSEIGGPWAPVSTDVKKTPKKTTKTSKPKE